MSFVGEHAIACSDVLAALRELPDNSVDALMCDPPYGLAFMGKRWDYDVPSVEVWREALRVLKPGAPLVAFGGTRTYHRMAVNIEDAGFELRDCLMFLYGKGFPKSMNVAKALDAHERFGGSGSRQLRERDGRTAGVVGTNMAAHRSGRNDVREVPRCLCGHAGNWHEPDCAHEGCSCLEYRSAATAVCSPLAQQWDGYGTALKPAWEPIILARKPLDGTMAANVATWGVGGLAIDACRIEAHGRPKLVGTGIGYQTTGTGGSGSSHADGTTDEGRWPANLILDEAAGAELDASVAPTKSMPYRENAADGAVLPMTRRTSGGYSDAGGPSRFFYSAKVSTKEREYGCEALAKRSAGEMTEREDGQDGLESPRAGAGRGGGARNHHPTLKPLALTRWLASLIKPPRADAVLLVPYSGAGSEMIGALQAGWGCVFGIEGEQDYVEIANARIAAWGKKDA